MGVQADLRNTPSQGQAQHEKVGRKPLWPRFKNLYRYKNGDIKDKSTGQGVGSYSLTMLPDVPHYELLTKLSPSSQPKHLTLHGPQGQDGGHRPNLALDTAKAAMQTAQEGQPWVLLQRRR